MADLDRSSEKYYMVHSSTQKFTLKSFSLNFSYSLKTNDVAKYSVQTTDEADILVVGLLTGIIVLIVFLIIVAVIFIAKRKYQRNPRTVQTTTFTAPTYRTDKNYVDLGYYGASYENDGYHPYETTDLMTDSFSNFEENDFGSGYAFADNTFA